MYTHSATADRIPNKKKRNARNYAAFAFNDAMTSATHKFPHENKFVRSVISFKATKCQWNTQAENANYCVSGPICA